MFDTRPIKFWGVTITACYGLPIIVFGAIVIVSLFAAFVYTTRNMSPVKLTAIWLEPRVISVATVAAQTKDHAAVKLGKTGYWTQLCPGYARQTYFDEKGNELAKGGKHWLDVPKKIGPIDHVPRPIYIPKTLKDPGVYRVRLDDYMFCWPWEWWFDWPVLSTSVEATFEIVPSPPIGFRFTPN